MRLRRVPAALALACLAVGAALAIRQGIDPLASNEVESMSVAGFSLEIFLGIVAFAGAMLSPESPHRRLGLGPGRISVTRILVLALGTLCLSYGLYGVLEISGLKDQSSLGEFEGAIAGIRGRTLVFAIVGLVLAPGIAEELLCRGLFQWGLAPVMGAPAAIAVGALVFGVLHVDPVHAAFATALGLYLGAAAHVAGSVRASIACHTLNNLGAIATADWDPPAWAVGPVAIALALGTAAILLAAVARSGLPPRRGPEADPDPGRSG